jgi:hypothetical protein
MAAFGEWGTVFGDPVVATAGVARGDGHYHNRGLQSSVSAVAIIMVK